MATKAQAKQLRRYLTELMSWLRMDNWDVVIIDEPDTGEDVLASVQTLRNHTTIHLRLGLGFWEQSDWTLTETLVHELLHALHRDVAFLWEDWVQHSEQISHDNARDATSDFHTFMERFVSDVARRLAPFAPQWPGNGWKAARHVRMEKEYYNGEDEGGKA